MGRQSVALPLRTLSEAERLHYLSAVQCTLRKPAITPSTAAPGALSRYEDLVATHINQTMSIHFVGHFLPWHRLFTLAYETLLREECGYRDAQPYWDWTLDSSASKFIASPVFDAVSGFGGNGPLTSPYNASANEVPGRTGGGCVPSGPFSNMTVHLGPFASLARNDQCLKRDFAPDYAVTYLSKANVDKVLNQLDYGWMARTLEGGTSFDQSKIHAGGHFGVGGTFGQMGDPFASPSDPIFWLHHANLDRVWWSWQSKNLTKRLRDVSGPIVLQDYENAQAGNVTLQFSMTLGFNGWDAQVEDMMDIRPLCYGYDRLY
ncbi:Di-copper centre-containing protein [Setomelanomma holmii]|uniref:Di-copper centre-containing protein n=1 Tax=Setomelanomma holmii TaxID=210430 RepID=A0A9P4HG56_9PLEO|nr:Di-copper centre-containing protein [Setomelanomma holmii]